MLSVLKVQTPTQSCITSLLHKTYYNEGTDFILFFIHSDTILK